MEDNLGDSKVRSEEDVVQTDEKTDEKTDGEAEGKAEEKADGKTDGQTDAGSYVASSAAETRTASAPSAAPSATSSTGPRPYVPQFSAATQMILSRISSTPGSLSAALSSASSVARSIDKSAFDDAKRRLVMNMNTSLTMPMYMPMPTPKPTPRRRLASMADSFQLRSPAPVSVLRPMKPVPAKPATTKPLPQKQKGKATRGTKRKRGKDKDNSSSSLSELSDSDIDAAANGRTPATMTKSGRQVQKPTQFNPVDTASSQKRKHYGKRTAEQALCKVCGRGLSPDMNRIVFCDGCNLCWHQMCHDPYILDEIVGDEARSWFCNRCMAKRERALAKKKTMEEYKGVSWASKTPAQKRTYLVNLPPAQLVNIIMYSTELHPDLPIFPAQESGAVAKRASQSGSTAAGAPPRADTRSIGPAHFHSTVSTPERRASDGGGKRAKRKGSTETQTQAEREPSADSVPSAWPRSGRGVLAGLDVKEEDLRDDDDFEAFSVMTYDNKGRKTRENGMDV